MFCKYCGTEVADDAKFCPACGGQIIDTDRPEWNTGRSTVNAERPSGSGVNQFQGSSGSRGDAVTAIGGSSLVLAFTIVFSAQILFSLFIGLSVLNVIAIITDIIVCVGCWLVYVNSSQHRANSTGFSVLRIGVPIYLVFSVVESFVSLVSIAGLFLGILRLLVIVPCLAVIAVSIWCYYGLCRTTSDSWKILKGESAEWRVTLSSVVILIIVAVFQVISVLISMVLFSNIAVVLANLLYAAVLILAIAILRSIRKQEQ